MTDRINVVRCWLPKGPKKRVMRHPLAWLEVDHPDGAVVVANLVGGGPHHRTVSEERFSAESLRGQLDEDQEPFDRFGVVTSCPCGDRYSVELVAVLKGQRQKPPLDTTDYRDLGISHDRKKTD